VRLLELHVDISKLKLLITAISSGFLASLASGTVSNESGVVLPEIKHYGYPLAWLVTNLNGPNDYVPVSFALDVAFWMAVSMIALVFLSKIAFPSLGIRATRKSLLLPIVLFVPLGLVMDIVHELGHALWGTAVGGTLTYLKVAYFEIYPRLAVTSQFQLGLTRVDGLTYGSFAYGAMLLGGSLTTNIASWILGLVLLRTNVGNRTETAIKVLGIFGILDLPFYVIFPQIGLGHWVFFGGGQGPEPLIGAQMMCMHDSAFYLVTALSSAGLAMLYSETLREGFSRKLRGSFRARSNISERKSAESTNDDYALSLTEEVAV
jgi:hypothetical protein